MSLEQLLNAFKQELRARYGDRLVKVILYGSHARGTAIKESDIDLLVILRNPKPPTQEIDELADILAKFNLEYGVLISVLPVSEEVFQEASGPFWRTVHREGVVA